MALSLTEQLDNLYTTTWQQMKSTVFDQIFDATPFWFWLKSKGKLKQTSGGRFLTDPVQFAKNEDVQWITKGSSTALNDREFLTIARFDWRYLTVPVVRFGIDDHQNRGKWQIIRLMNSKLENAQNSLIDTLETALFQASGAATNSIDGLQFLVADDPTTAAAPGGIAQNTNTWWRSKTDTMAGVSFATTGVDRMRTMLNNTMNNLRMDAPDLILSGQTPFEYYEANVVDSYYRVTNNKLADAGFMHQVYKGIPMVWSPSCSNLRMYFLNTNFLTLQYDPMLNFDMTEWKPIPDQVNDRAVHIVWAGALTCSRLRCQGVIHTINTA